MVGADDHAVVIDVGSVGGVRIRRIERYELPAGQAYESMPRTTFVDAISYQFKNYAAAVVTATYGSAVNVAPRIKQQMRGSATICTVGLRAEAIQNTKFRSGWRNCRDKADHERRCHASQTVCASNMPF